MGLLSGLGRIVGKVAGPLLGVSGPVGAAVGGVLGGFADATAERNAAKKAIGDANYRNDTNLIRLRAQAKKAGFHPLEALRSGAGNIATHPVTVPALATNAALTGAFENIESIFSGEAAREKERKEFEHDLFVQNAKERLAGGASTIVERTLRSNKIAVSPNRSTVPKVGQGSRVVQTTQGPKVMSEIANPTPVNPDGSIDITIDDGGTGVQLAPRDRVVTRSGETVDVTVGPDIDEMLTGMLIDGAGAYKASRMKRAANNMGREAFIDAQTRKSVVEWLPEAGQKPVLWDRWSKERRIAYLASRLY